MMPLYKLSDTPFHNSVLHNEITVYYNKKVSHKPLTNFFFGHILIKWFYYMYNIQFVYRKSQRL